MEDMELTKIESKIIESINYVSDNGGFIISNDYGVEWDGENWAYDNNDKECCPFGALLLKHQPKEPDLYKAIFNTLEIDSQFLWDFLPAFDMSQNIVLDYTNGGIVGAKIRKFIHQ